MVKAGDPDTIDLCDSAVRLLFRQLPDPAVCAFLPDLVPRPATFALSGPARDTCDDRRHTVAPLRARRDEAP